MYLHNMNSRWSPGTQWNLSEVQVESTWSPPNPPGVSGVHLESTWTMWSTVKYTHRPSRTLDAPLLRRLRPRQGGGHPTARLAPSSPPLSCL